MVAVNAECGPSLVRCFSTVGPSSVNSLLLLISSLLGFFNCGAGHACLVLATGKEEL